MYLGLNAFSHDASAAIVDETGRIIAAVEEERFTRIKQENRFPEESIRYCLKAAGIGASDLKGIGYGWHPLLLIFQRVLWSTRFRWD
jgi:carbamoyltransferase